MQTGWPMGNLERIERQHVSRARAYAACTKDSLICLVFFGGFREKLVIFDEKRAMASWPQRRPREIDVGVWRARQGMTRSFRLL